MNIYDVDNKTLVPISEVNENIKKDTALYVEQCEEMYFSQIGAVADHIEANIHTLKVVLMAGPSSSGKTTTAFKIRDLLKARGIGSLVVSLDDFFRGNGSFPVLPDGKTDYESIGALDVERIQSCLSELLKTGSTLFPVYDFATGNRKKEKKRVSVGETDVLILEGIHALNPVILPSDIKDGFLKLYACIQSQYGENGKVILSSRNNRLMRRMIRDYKYRSASPERTLDMWDNVCRGEDRNIRPFKSQADFIIDSAHRYEPCIYHHELHPLLEKIDKNSMYYGKVSALCDILDLFWDIELEFLPKESLLREFLG